VTEDRFRTKGLVAQEEGTRQVLGDESVRGEAVALKKDSADRDRRSGGGLLPTLPRGGGRGKG